MGDDPESTKARHDIIEDVEMKMKTDPSDPARKVVKYGPFLKVRAKRLYCSRSAYSSKTYFSLNVLHSAEEYSFFYTLLSVFSYIAASLLLRCARQGFRDSLEKSPLVSANPYMKSEEDHAAAVRKRANKSDLTIDEILKAMDANLPKYYKSTTEAFLRMKPPGGIFRIADFARFMRSINLDLPDAKLQELFSTYDKDGSGGLEAWEFIESFGPSINGHADTNTSLAFTPQVVKQSRALKEVPLSVEQVRTMIMGRLPLHYRSSTKAFLAAKGGVNPRSHTIAFKDLKVWLQNLNIIVPDDTIRGLFKYLDEDGSGDVSAREFIKAFGRAISGESAENINDAEHLSFHNNRPDKRVAVPPTKHKWTYDEVRQALSIRLGLIHTSSTKAFMKAKRSTSQTMSLADLKRMLLNLNIDPDDKIIRRMHKEIDVDGDGQIKCAEFVAMFGNDINGHSGSFESKPAWYHKEMDRLATQLKLLDSDGSSVAAKQGPGGHDDDSAPIEDEAEDFVAAAVMNSGGVQYQGSSASSSKKKSGSGLTKAQDVALKKKFGMLPDKEGLQTSPVGSIAPSFYTSERSLSSQPKSATPKPAATQRMQRPQSANASVRSATGGGASVRSGGGGASVTRVEYTGPEEASVDDASTVASAVSMNQPAHIPQNNPMPFYTEKPKRPASAGAARPVNLATDTARRMGEISDEELMQELLGRQRAKQTPGWRPRSAPRSRSQGGGSSRRFEDPEKLGIWDAPTSRFGGFNQGAHSKSTVATKLNQAKKMANVYAERKLTARVIFDSAMLERRLSYALFSPLVLLTCVLVMCF
jgi:Ca2+-binding EF-hand superfamily protein